MPNTIPTMKRKRHRDPKLQHPLRHPSQRSEPLRHRRTFQMPPKQGGGEVGGAEDVKTAAEDGAGYAV